MNCYITLSNSNNQIKKLTLKFNLFPIEIAHRWRNLVLNAQHLGYKIDDPNRFYGFKEKAIDIIDSITQINQTCDTINHYQNIIKRKLKDINDQDTLNYLHHIFEEYHGLLDQQKNKFWTDAPVTVKQALANLNIQVHRLESLQRKNMPRFVVTYFSLPKDQQLKLEDFNYMTNHYQFGGLYLNYVEIGKTLEDLMKDDDQYISADAFKPWKHFSADFKVMLANSNTIEARVEKQQCRNYFNTHREFFEPLGYTEFDPRLRPGNIQIGQMEYINQNILEQIADYQSIESVDFD